MASVLTGPGTSASAAADETRAHAAPRDASCAAPPSPDGRPRSRAAVPSGIRVGQPGARAALVARAPDAREEQVAPEHAAAVLCEKREQRELARRERHATPVERDLVERAIDDDASDLRAFVGRELAGGPLELAEARVKL